MHRRLDVLTAVGLAIAVVGACGGPDAPAPVLDERSAACAPAAFEAAEPGRRGDTLYVPIALEADGRSWRARATLLQTRSAALTTAVAVRNTDPRRAIRLESVCPYDTGGAPGPERLTRSVEVPPLGVHTIELRRAAGPRPVASVLVRWSADGAVRPPIAGQVRDSAGLVSDRAGRGGRAD